MKKPSAVLLYSGVVLRGSGMIIIPSMPKPKSPSARIPMMATVSKTAHLVVPTKRK